MSNPEFQQLTPSEQLSQMIDAKFMSGTARRGGIVRDHEESLALIPTTSLSHCPEASRVYLERPIPEEEVEAAARWQEFGGHRVTVYECNGQIHTSFVAKDGEVLKRQTISPYGDFLPFRGETVIDQVIRRAREDLGDALSLLALGGAERAAEIKKRNQGEPILPEEIDELLAWINTAIPEQ